VNVIDRYVPLAAMRTVATVTVATCFHMRGKSDVFRSEWGHANDDRMPSAYWRAAVVNILFPDSQCRINHVADVANATGLRPQGASVSSQVI